MEKLTDTDVKAFMLIVNSLPTMEEQLQEIAALIRRDKELINHPAVSEWTTKHSTWVKDNYNKTFGHLGYSYSGK